MPIFHVTSPDGRTVEVTAPEGATEEQAIKYAQDNWETLSKQPQPGFPQAQPEQPVQPQQAPQQNKTLEAISGISGPAVVEPVLKAATGTVAKGAGDVAGLLAIPLHAYGLTDKTPEEVQQRFQDLMTYSPKTEAGKSEWNPLNALPAAIGKAIDAIRPDKPIDSSTPEGMTINAIREAIPAAVSILGAKGAPLARIPARAAATSLRNAAESTMQSALKPTLHDLKNGKAAVAIDTMLEKGLSPTAKGVEQIRSRIDDLNKQIGQEIANSPERVTTAKIARPVVEKLREFRNQVTPQADVAQIKKTWAEFKNHPLIQGRDIPVPLAQELKQGTYRQLSKKYGQIGSAETEAQKSIARGIKEQIAEKVPSIRGLNAEESKLLKTLSVVERRALMDANKNPLGLSVLAHNPAAWAAFMADKSAVFKSLLARTMNAASKNLESGAETTTRVVAPLAPAETAREERKKKRKENA